MIADRVRPLVVGQDEDDVGSPHDLFPVLNLGRLPPTCGDHEE